MRVIRKKARPLRCDQCNCLEDVVVEMDLEVDENEICVRLCPGCLYGALSASKIDTL